MAQPSRARTPQKLPNDPCPFDPAMIERLVGAVEALAQTADDLRPAAKALEDLNSSQVKFCVWLKKWRWVLIFFLPAAGTALGRVSPEVADRLLALILGAAGG